MIDATDVIIVILIMIALLGIAQWYHYKSRCDTMERQLDIMERRLRRIRMERMRNA